MQMFKPFMPDVAERVGRGLSALLVTSAPDGGRTAALLRALGVRTWVEERLARARAETRVPGGCADMVVIDCDPSGNGALAAMMRTVYRSVSPGVPVLLIAPDCAEQRFPDQAGVPFLLRAPVSVVALRLSLESAFPSRCGLGHIGQA